VHEAEDVGRRAEFFQGFDDGVVSVEVLLDFAGLDVKDVD
jgi:hypothetical protein